MSNKQLAAIISAVAIISASLGIVLTHRAMPSEVKVSIDLPSDSTLALGPSSEGSHELQMARKGANESAAISMLRAIYAAQSQLESSISIDTDQDGGGEFGYFGELSGSAGLREFNPESNTHSVGTRELTIPILPTAFGTIVSDGATDGVVERHGYYFKMWLPGRTAKGVTRGVSESGRGGARPKRLPDPDNSEILWACYAWPKDAGTTGTRVFFLNQEGDLLQFLNQDLSYSGLSASSIPSFDAAYSNSTGGGDMSARLGITAIIAHNGEAANDGHFWSVVGY